MTAGRWALGLLCLACIWFAPYLGARRLVRRMVPGVAGAGALLASLVLTMVLITLVSEGLGSVGEFRRWPLVAGTLVVGALAARAGLPNSTRRIRERPDLPTLVAGGLVIAVCARWAIGLGTSLRAGISATDSIQYHMPFAATFAQSGWLSRPHYAWWDPVWTFYPYGSELFHAIGMEAFGRDVLSPVLNLGWLALALLAAWCCGSRWKAGPLTLAIGCVVFSLPELTVSQPGSANGDVACLALLLSTVALLFAVADTRGGYLLMGLAAGLAASTTLYALPPVVGLAVGLLIFDRRDIRAKRSLGALGLLVAGGYWYLRNLILLGNPFPGFKVGPLHLPAPKFPIVAKFGFSVAHYLPHAWFWEHYVRPGLHTAFGSGWPLIAALFLAGAVTSLKNPVSPLFRAVWVGGAVAAIVYVFTPTSAYGPPGDPLLFAANLRFLFPSVVWSMMLGGVFLSQHRLRWVGERFDRPESNQLFWVVLAAIFSVLTLAYPHGTDRAWSDHPLFALIGGVAALLVVALALVRRPGLRVMGGVALVLAVAAAGLPVAHRYLADRYTGDGPLYHWARNLQGARIGVVAFAEQYPLFGLDLDNQVSYVGTAGPQRSLVLAADCTDWRRQLSSGRYDFVVIGDNDWTSAPIPQLAWTESDPAARAVAATSPRDPGPKGVVYRLVPGTYDTAGCPA